MPLLAEELCHTPAEETRDGIARGLAGAFKNWEEWSDEERAGWAEVADDMIIGTASAEAEEADAEAECG